MASRRGTGKRDEEKPGKPPPRPAKKPRGKGGKGPAAMEQGGRANKPASSPCLLDEDDPQIDPRYLG